MAKVPRPSSVKTSSSKSAKPALKSKAPEPVEEPMEDDMDVEESLPAEKTKRPSGKISSRKSSRSSGKSPKSKSVKKDANATRSDILESRQKTTNKRIIIAAVLLVLILLGFMFGGNYVDDQRVNAVKNLSMENEKNLEEYYRTESIISVAKSGNAAIRKLNKSLEKEIADGGPIATKNNLIAGLSYTYKMNRKLTIGGDSITLLKKIIEKKDGNQNRKFAIQALASIPGGIAELENIITNKENDAETSLIALNALPKTSTGKISSKVLVFALEKNDPDFLKKIFPFVIENMEMFKEEVNAVKVLLKISGNADDAISKSAFELLGKCIYKPEHYKILQNKALDENAKIKENALNCLLGSSPQSAGEALSSVLALTKDTPTKLKILEKLGTPECAAFYDAIVPALRSPDKEVVIGALVAIGKQKNTPEKGLKDVISCLSNENVEVKIAAVTAIKGFEYRKPFYYTDKPEQIPTFTLIKLIDAPEDNLKAEVIKALEKISGEPQISVSGWKDWFAKEKSVLDMLIEMEKSHKLVQEKFKKTMFKEAKEELKKMEQIYNTIFSEYSKTWAGFDGYLQKKGEEYLLLRVSVNKASPIDH